MSGTGTNARCILIDYDDATGIGNLTTLPKREGGIYNLAGQMVSAESLPLKRVGGPSLFITGGKLVVVK